MPDTPEESGPDFSTFGGSAAAGGIIGTNHLQKSIDEFTRAVDKLDTIVKSMPGSGMVGGLRTVGPTSQVGGSTGATGGFPTVYNPFAAPMGGYPTVGPTSPYQGQAPQYGNAGYVGGTWASQTGGGQSFPPVYNPYANGGSGSGPPPFSPKPTYGGPPPGGGGSSMTFGQRAQAMGGSLLGGFTMAAAIGKQVMPSQLSLNTLSYQGALYTNGGFPTPTSINSFMNQQAAAASGTYGTATSPTRLNTWAFNPRDMYQSFGMMSQQSGYSPGAIMNANPNATMGQLAVGSQLLSQTRQLSYANPAMSGTQATQLGMQMMSPQASLSAHMMGLPAFRPMGRPGAYGMGTNMANLFTAFGANPSNAGQWNQHALAADLAPGGRINYMLGKAYGLNQSQISGFGNEMLIYNKLFHAGLSGNRAQTLLSNANSNNDSLRAGARQRLRQLGVPETDLNKLKQLGGTTAAKIGDTSQGFTEGLTAATHALEDFRKALQKTLNTTGMNQAQGWTQGLGAVTSSFANIGLGAAGLGLAAKFLTGLMGKSVGGLIFKGIKGILGGGGSAAADTGAATAGAADTGAAAAGGGILGTAAGVAGMAAPAIAGFAAAATMGPGHYSKHKPAGMTWEQYMYQLIHQGKLSPRAATQWMVGGHFNSAKFASFIQQNGTNVQGGGASAVPIGGMATGFTQTPAGPVLSLGLGGKSGSTTQVASKTAMTAVRAAEAQVGTPYQYGGENPHKGFDCGGLTQWAYRQAGVTIPHTAKDQWRYLHRRQVPMNELEEGDLVFGLDDHGSAEHVGLMVSKDRVIQAPGAGKQVQVGLFRRAMWQHAARPTGRVGPGVASAHGGLAGGTKNPQIHGGAGKQNNGGGSGGYVDPFKGIKHLQYTRIDQGVDFAGSGPIDAIGPGVVMETNGRGWPGGPFMSYRLTSGPAAGKVVYVAEQITPTVHAGEHVAAGQQIARMRGYIETGWANASGTTPMSQTGAAGGIGGGNLPGGGTRPTRIGLNFDELLVALGVHKAPNFSLKPGGKLPSGFPNWMKTGLTGSPGGSGGSGGLSLTQTLFSTGGPAGTGADLGAGDVSTEGSTSELSAYQAAISGGLTAGSGYNATQQVGLGLTQTAGGGSGTGGSAGPTAPGLVSVAKFLLAHGFSKAAAAGIAGTIAGESGGNPESQGSGGGGLIGWTPISSAKPNPHIITGNAKRDMGVQLNDLLYYAEHEGQGHSLSSLKGSTNPMKAAQAWSQFWERPAVRFSDIRQSIVNSLFKKGLATGGIADAGNFALVGERGPEIVQFGQQANVYNSAQTQKLLKQQAAQGPHMAGPASPWNTSPWHPAYSGGAAGTKLANQNCTLNFGPNSINITMPAGSQSLSTGANARAMSRQFMEALQKEYRHTAIASGVNS